MSGTRDAELVEIGYVLRAHGVRGELRVVTHDPESTALDDARELTIGGVRYGARIRKIDGAYLVELDGIRDRDRAHALKGQPVAVPRDSLDLGPDEVLLSDLVGFEVKNAAGESLGQVVEIETGPQDRLVVQSRELETLIPVVDEFLVEISPERREILVELPEEYPTRRIGGRY